MNAPTPPFQIYLRGATYWVRFSIKGQGQQRMSLGTKDAEKAEKLAEETYQHAIWSAEHGLLAGKTSFDKVAREYLDHLDALAQSNPKKLSVAKAESAIANRYLIPYFGKTTVTSITEPKLYKYLEWRKAYWVSGPGAHIDRIEYQFANGKRGFRKAKHEPPHPNTIRREASALRGIFEHAVRLGYLKRGEVPQLRLDSAKKNKRPAFTEAEVNTLLEVAEQRMAQSLGQPKLLHERCTLFAFISAARHTGLRPTELFNLNWDHVIGFKEERNKPGEERRVLIAAYGKGKGPQQMVPKRSVVSAFDTLWDLFEKTHGRAPAPNDPVFTNVDGERLKSLKKSLNSLLDVTGLKRDAFGRARTAYSLRHTYASSQIRDGVDIYTLAINMRTSIRMIEMYYSDVLPTDRAKILEGEW